MSNKLTNNEILNKKQILLFLLSIFLSFNLAGQISQNYTKITKIKKDLGHSDTTILFRYYDDKGKEIFVDSEFIIYPAFNVEVIDSTAKVLKKNFYIDDIKVYYQHSDSDSHFERFLISGEDTTNLLIIEKDKNGQFKNGVLNSKDKIRHYSLKGVYTLAEFEKIEGSISSMPSKYLNSRMKINYIKRRVVISSIKDSRNFIIYKLDKDYRVKKIIEIGYHKDLKFQWKTKTKVLYEKYVHGVLVDDR